MRPTGDLVIRAIQEGHKTFEAIDAFMKRGEWDGSFRATDREIQKLRKKGVISFRKGKWEWMKP